MILVVEDDDTLRLLATKQLARLGYIAHSAADGEQAVSRVRENEYTLILMDIQMPRMDGIEATCAIRESEKTAKSSRVPIIAMTANPDRDRCLEAGMDDFVFKPVMLEQLQSVLDRWIPATTEQKTRRTSGRKTQSA